MALRSVQENLEESEPRGVFNGFHSLRCVKSEVDKSIGEVRLL